MPRHNAGSRLYKAGLDQRKRRDEAHQKHLQSRGGATFAPDLSSTQKLPTEDLPNIPVLSDEEESDEGDDDEEVSDPEGQIEFDESKLGDVQLDDDEEKNVEKEMNASLSKIDPSEEEIQHKIMQSIVEAFEECGSAPSGKVLFSSYGSLMTQWEEGIILRKNSMKQQIEAKYLQRKKRRLVEQKTEELRKLKEEKKRLREQKKIEKQRRKEERAKRRAQKLEEIKQAKEELERRRKLRQEKRRKEQEETFAKLYKEATENRKKSEEYRHERLKNEMAGCTFRPHIKRVNKKEKKKTPRNATAKNGNSTKEDSNASGKKFEELYQDAEKRRKQLQKVEKRPLYSFSPKITRKGKMANSKKEESFVKRLYESGAREKSLEGKKRRQKIIENSKYLTPLPASSSSLPVSSSSEQPSGKNKDKVVVKPVRRLSPRELRERREEREWEAQKKECTFLPNVHKQMKKQAVSGKKTSERLYQEGKKFVKKRKKLEKEAARRPPNCTFRPKINRLGDNKEIIDDDPQDRHDPKIFDRLYKEGVEHLNRRDVIQAKKRQEEEEVLRAMKFHPKKPSKKNQKRGRKHYISENRRATKNRSNPQQANPNQPVISVKKHNPSPPEPTQDAKVIVDCLADIIYKVAEESLSPREN
eukprot:g3994.t1